MSFFLIVALTLMALVTVLGVWSLVYAEEYVYEPTIINGHYFMDEIEIYGIITEPDPTVCAFEVEDHLMPEGTDDVLLQLAEKSVKKWERALSDYTQDHNSWDINFKVIPMSEQWKEEEIDLECEVIIYFLREEIEDLWEANGLANFDAYGLADNFGPVSDVYIIYRDVVYNEIEYEYFDENEELVHVTEYEPYYYVNELAPEVEDTITHELGHAFSLDHIPTDWNKFVEKDGIMFSPTIMGEPSEIPEWYLDEIGWEVTERDVLAMIELYGLNGFEPDGELGFSDYLFKEPSLIQKTLKDNIEKYPEHFPAKYINLLDSMGLII